MTLLGAPTLIAALFQLGGMWPRLGYPVIAPFMMLVGLQMFVWPLSNDNFRPRTARLIGAFLFLFMAATLVLTLIKFVSE